MNFNIENRIKETTNILEDGISSDGFPIFVLERDLTVSYDGRERLVRGWDEDLVFYTSDEKIINSLRKQLTKQENSGYIDDTKLIKFLHRNKNYLIDNTVNPLNKLGDSAGTAYYNLTQNYKKTLINSEYGVCHLIKNDEILIFRCWFDGFNKNNPNVGLRGLYDKPIYTIEEILERNVIVDSLYSKGEIQPECVINGNAAQKLISHILEENKKLPTNYQNELSLILTEFAKIEKYNITKKINTPHLEITLNTEKFGSVEFKLPRNKDDKIIISYGDTKEEIKSIKDIFIKFHVDRTKEKVNILSKKINF